VPVLSYRPDVARPPASTMKLVTSAGALLALGPEFRFTTGLYARPGTVSRRGVLRGPLYLRGQGDPLLATPAYSRVFLGGNGTPLGLLGGRLKRAGVQAVMGPIVADEGFFDAARGGPLWKASYVSECPPLSALAVNQDTAGDRRGPNVASPPIAAAQRLRRVLTAVGVRQRGPLKAGAVPAGAQVVAAVRSQPLRVILRLMNPDSDNFIAETLMKDIGAYTEGRGTTAAGTAHTAAALDELGVLGPNDRLVDGSGLSHSNRLSATTLVRLLTLAVQTPSWGVPLLNSMPRGGQGTLIRRFRGSTTRLRVRAKTGYINGTSTLAGVVTSVSGKRYAFALLMNTPNTWGARVAQDAIVTLLAGGAGDAAAPAS
jgi:serine-type D-Ala-D-Ala carboxypeptidase/endopeptidase (penicillin-binding protein 4)